MKEKRACFGGVRLHSGSHLRNSQRAEQAF